MKNAAATIIFESSKKRTLFSSYLKVASYKNNQKNKFMKFHIYLTSLLILLISFAAKAQTEVSGGIFAPTEWPVSGSPYIVTGDVVIFPGQSLTIAPGSEVRFAEGTKLEVRSGFLYANGSENNRITFTLDSADPANAPKWVGIENTSLTDTTSMEFDYVNIEYAEIGIHYGGGAGLYRDMHHLDVQHCETGVYMGNTGYEWGRIYDSNFENNAIATSGRVSLFNSTAQDNSIVCADIYSFGTGAEGGRIIDCDFSNNEVCIQAVNTIITSAYLENSTFTENEKVAECYRIEASNCVFDGSTTWAVQSQTGTIENCTFTDNAIGFLSFFAPYENYILNNNFNGNDIAIQLEGPDAVVMENAICNSNTYGVVSTTSDPVDVANNCWCTTDENLVPALIYDAYDNVALGIATFSPISTFCSGELFFAGDANNDGAANAWDVLNVGLAYGQTGSAHGQGAAWQGLEVSDWGSAFASGLDKKHADANGDGLIDAQDLLVIEANYGNTHTNTADVTPIIDESTTYELSLMVPDVLVSNQAVSMDVEISEVNNLYGIAFALQADAAFYEAGSFSLNLSNSILGDASELLVVIKEMSADNRIEIGIVRKDGQAISGVGILGKLDFVISEDLIVSVSELTGGTTQEAGTLEIALENVMAINGEGHILQTNTESVAIVVSSTNDINDALATAISIYPNPISNEFIIQTDQLTINEVILYNTTGQRLRSIQNPQNINIGDLTDGVYLLKIITKDGSITKKIIKE